MLEDTFSDIVGKARYGKGWSLSDLAQRSALSESRIEALEGGAAPTSSEIDLLSESLALEAKKLAVIARSEWEPRAMESDWCRRHLRKIDGHIGNYGVNGYLFFDPEQREGVLFDTGYSPPLVIQAIKEEGIRLAAICITHTHVDHIGGAESVQSATGAPIYVHRDEFYGENRIPKGVTLIEATVPVRAGRFSIQPLRTPGHTPGGTSFLIAAGDRSDQAVAFVGDALFAGSLGRAHAPATYALLIRSVRSALLSLPKQTLLMPGHGPATTVEEEQNHNPFFTGPF